MWKVFKGFTPVKVSGLLAYKQLSWGNFTSWPDYKSTNQHFTTHSDLRGYNKLEILHVKTTTYGLWSYRYFAPHAWNNLTDNIRMSEMLASFKCNIIDYIKIFIKSCLLYFVLLLLLFFCGFLYYDTINNLLMVLILCSSGILALSATLQSEINNVMNEWMNEWMNSGKQIFKFMRCKCKLSFPSSLPHPLSPGAPGELAHRLMLS